MSYRIRCKDSDEACFIMGTLREHLERSRFSAEMYVTGLQSFYVNFAKIRLLKPKGYCGNHAGPCKLTGRSHRNLRYLEGLDWVSFNDMVNDALDFLLHGGNAGSRLVNIRLGKQRRTVYESNTHDGEFDKYAEEGAYMNYCGKSSPGPSWTVPGTPGIAGWGKECVEAPYEEAVA